jgi:hypothetical protein
MNHQSKYFYYANHQLLNFENILPADLPDFQNAFYIKQIKTQ